MKSLSTASPSRDHRIVGRVFGTPLVIEGQTWLPVTQLGIWLLMSRAAGRNRSDLNPFERLATGALTTSVLLGSEWCHNLAHAYAANNTGKPMDKIKILWGMPRCVYEDINDTSVTPRQHILRSLGGPIFNFITLLVATFTRFLTRPNSISREITNVAVGTNAFLSTVSLLPIPGIDGGPILKWSFVDRGYEIHEADEQVRKVNGLLSLILASISGIAFRKNKRFFGILSLLLSIVSFGVFARWIQEERIPF